MSTVGFVEKTDMVNAVIAARATADVVPPEAQVGVLRVYFLVILNLWSRVHSAYTPFSVLLTFVFAAMFRNNVFESSTRKKCQVSSPPPRSRGATK